MPFFCLDFPNVSDILAQTMYNVHTIFCQFSDNKNGDDPNSHVSLVSFW